MAQEDNNLKKQNEELIAENQRLEAEVLRLEAELKASNEIAEIKKPIYVKVAWKSPKGEKVEQTVTITNPTVRVGQDIVNSRDLLEQAAAKAASPEKTKALELITHWAQIRAGFIQEKSAPKK